MQSRRAGRAESSWKAEYGNSDEHDILLIIVYGKTVRSCCSVSCKNSEIYTEPSSLLVENFNSPRAFPECLPLGYVRSHIWLKTTASIRDTNPLTCLRWKLLSWSKGHESPQMVARRAAIPLLVTCGLHVNALKLIIERFDQDNDIRGGLCVGTLHHSLEDICVCHWFRIVCVSIIIINNTIRR